MGRPKVNICPRGHDKTIVGRQGTTRRCKGCLREWDRERRTGCTPEIFRKLNQLQNGLCATCFLTDKNGLTADHDHRTGQIRGLLCHMCNLALGNAKDSPELLRKLATYLEGRSYVFASREPK